MAERKPKPKPPIEEPDKKPPLEEPAPPALPELTAAQQKRAKKFVENYREINRGGAPISEEFVMAALQQGLDIKQVKAIVRSQALGGPQTSGSYSSSELLDYFTANPGEIQGLLDAVRTTHDAPANYAEYLAGGGEPGGYPARNQLLQEGVLAIGGGREAYLAGTSRQQFINEGNDPNRWYLDGPEWMDQQAQAKQADAFVSSSDMSGLDSSQLTSLSDAASQMLSARQRRAAAYGDYFDSTDLVGGAE